MVEATVTSRMPASTKSKVQQILKRNGTNSSKVINALFDRIIDEGGIAFLSTNADEKQALREQNLQRAVEFVDSIPVARTSEFDSMTHAQVKASRLKHRDLM